MRRIATVTGHPEVKRVMLCSSKHGCYLFLYDQIEDGPCDVDHLEDSAAEAEQTCFECYGVSADDWQTIPDPLPSCQDDWIATVRAAGRQTGNPEWGCFERLENGVWKRLDAEHTDAPDP